VEKPELFRDKIDTKNCLGKKWYNPNKWRGVFEVCPWYIYIYIYKRGIALKACEAAMH